MKKITVLLAVLALAGPAYAQQPAKEPAKPQAKEQAKPAAQEAPKPATMAEAPKPPRKQTPSRRSEDARQCLEKGTNTEIIKCAEEYL